MLAAKIAASTGVSSPRNGRKAGLGSACPIVSRLPRYLPPCGGGRRCEASAGGGCASAVPLRLPPSPTLPHKGGGSERDARLHRRIRTRDADGQSLRSPHTEQL